MAFKVKHNWTCQISCAIDILIKKYTWISYLRNKITSGAEKLPCFVVTDSLQDVILKTSHPQHFSSSNMKKWINRSILFSWGILQTNILRVIKVQPLRTGRCYPKNSKWGGGQVAHHFERCSILFSKIP